MTEERLVIPAGTAGFVLSVDLTDIDDPDMPEALTLAPGSTVTFEFTRPDGSIIMRMADISSDRTAAMYEFVDGDLDAPGQWAYRTVITRASDSSVRPSRVRHAFWVD